MESRHTYISIVEHDVCRHQNIVCWIIKHLNKQTSNTADIQVIHADKWLKCYKLCIGYDKVETNMEEMNS